MTQTINTGTRPKHDFRIWRSVNNQFYWVYYDGNHEALVTSEMFTRLENAQRSLRNFKDEMGIYFKR